MGVFERHFFNIANGDLIWTGFRHFWPIIILYSFVYRYFSVYFVLILQSLFIVLGGYVIDKMTEGLDLDKRFLVIISYYLFFGTWYNVLFDFHLEHLVIFLSVMVYFLFEKEKYILGVVISYLLGFVKEVYFLVGFMFGIYLLLKHRKFILGIILSTISLCFFIISTHYIIPFFSCGFSPTKSSAFTYLNISDIINFIILNPKKYMFLFLIIFSFGIIPVSLSSFVYLLPGIPILAISFISKIPNHYSIASHYTAGIIAPFTMSLKDSISKLRFLSRNNYKRIIYFMFVLIVLVHIMFSPSPISRYFITNKSWSFGYEAYIPTKRDKMIKQAIKKYIPADPEIAVATQNTLNWRYIAHRKYYFAFPTGVIEPALIPEFNTSLWKIVSSFWKNKYVRNQPPSINYRPIYAQYVLIDLKRPWYVNDQGCNWQTGKPLVLTKEEIEKIGLKEDPGPFKWAGCADTVHVEWLAPSGEVYKGTLRELFLKMLYNTLKAYRIIYENDGFLILERVHFTPSR